MLAAFAARFRLKFSYFSKHITEINPDLGATRSDTEKFSHCRAGDNGGLKCSISKSSMMMQTLRAQFALNALHHFGLLASSRINPVLLDGPLSVHDAKTGSLKSSTWRRRRAKWRQIFRKAPAAWRYSPRLVAPWPDVLRAPPQL